MEIVLIGLALFAAVGLHSPAPSFDLSHPQPDQVQNEYVLLLHGIARSSRHMESLATALTDEGYKVINLDYPSRHQTIEEMSAFVASELDRRLPDGHTVHFVGYSMGGLVARGVVRWHRPEKLGRVVQLAPPNCGSEVADFVQNRWLYKQFYGPAGQQLVTSDDCHVSWLGGVDYNLGIVAGNRSIDPVSSTVIKGRDDGKVAVERTRLDAAADHIVVPANHTFFPKTDIVISQTIYFLHRGAFWRDH